MKSRDVLGQWSPLMGCSMVKSPVSGTWVLHEYDLIFWAAQGLHWVSWAGVTFGTAGVVGTAVVSGCGVTGVAHATGMGCTGCTGLLGTGCGTETQGLAAGVCNVVVVVSGTVSAGLTLHSCRCHLMWW